MAGHSKWANIKRKKGAVDAKRGKLFTKLIREITVAAKLGGGDLSSNPRLRDAVSEAKSKNMQKDTIERAIKRGTGEGDGADYFEITYEGYGPGGAAIIIESLTDNRNRTVSEIRAAMTRNGGNLGESGSVAWIFDKKGLIAVHKTGIDEDKLMEMSLEAGADDIQDDGEIWEVLTPVSAFSQVREALEAAKVSIESAGLTQVPKTTVRLEGEAAEQMLELMEVLEDLDDVQRVSGNFDIDEKEMDRLNGISG